MLMQGMLFLSSLKKMLEAWRQLGCRLDWRLGKKFPARNVIKQFDQGVRFFRYGLRCAWLCHATVWCQRVTKMYCSLQEPIAKFQHEKLARKKLYSVCASSVHWLGSAWPLLMLLYCGGQTHRGYPHRGLPSLMFIVDRLRTRGASGERKQNNL